MTRHRFGLLCGLLLALVLPARAAFAEDPAVLALGAPLPQAAAHQAMSGIDGKTYTLAGLAGQKGTLVIFSCVHCPFVKAWDSRMAKLGNEYQQRGVGVVLVNSNDPAVNQVDGIDGMKEQAQAKGYAFPYVIDATSDVARAFGARKTPDAFLFDAGGKLVYHGAIDDKSEDAAAATQHYLRDALEAVATGGTVPVAETKALGCGIKFRTP